MNLRWKIYEDSEWRYARWANQCPEHYHDDGCWVYENRTCFDSNSLERLIAGSYLVEAGSYNE